MSEVSILDEAETKALEAELEQLYGIAPSVPEHPNPAINSLFRNFSPDSTDSRGRTIIDYETYQALVKADARLDSYMLKMKGPSGIGLAPAAKFQKYWGDGYRPVTRDDLAVPSVQNHKTVVDRDQITIYYCSDKYSGCPRFFDSIRGREVHWGMEHEKKVQRKRNKNGA